MTEIIRVDIYNRDVLVHTGNLKPLRKYLRKFIGKETIREVMDMLSRSSLGKTVEIENSGLIVYIPKYSDTPKCRAVLVHELFHVSYMILKKAGIDCTDYSDEAYAYLLQFLTERAFTSLSASQQQ